MIESVCAVVVTYNRKALLQRCLCATLAQTRPPEAVLVVNNASTDGTVAMLEQDFPGIQRLDLAQNLGAAHGFHFGIAWAVAQGFTWVALMDDDGYPAPDCFARLLASPDPALQVRGALVLDEANESRLAFFLPAAVPVDTVAGAESLARNGIILRHLSPFNGLFVAGSVVDAIGLPEKDDFLWGDEAEYYARMKQAGIPLGIVTAARCYRPRR